MIKNNNRVLRLVEWFSKKNGHIAGEEKIENFDLEFFKKLFNHTYPDDPYIYNVCYDILLEHVPTVQKSINHVIDLDKYNYQFSTYEAED